MQKIWLLESILLFNPGIFWKGDKFSRKELLQSGGLEFTIKFVMEGSKTKVSDE